MSWEWKYILTMLVHFGIFGLINADRKGMESLPTNAWMDRHQVITVIWAASILATPIVFLYWVFTL
jgi:hypothetical protein